MKATGILVLSGALLLSVLGAPSPALGNSEADVDDPELDVVVEPTDQEVHESTISAFADRDGVSFEEAEMRWEDELRISSLTTSIREVVGEGVFAGAAGVAPGDTIVYFKGEIPPTAIRLVESAGLSGEVELRGGQRHSLDEMNHRLAQVNASVASRGFMSLATWDLTTQQITVQISDPQGRQQSEATEVAEAVLDDLNRGLSEVARQRSLFGPSDISIEVDVPGVDYVDLSHGYGGETILDTAAFGDKCTSGFVVRRSSDWKEGVLTAAHCESLDKLFQHNSSGGVVTSFSTSHTGAEHLGWWGDFEWHTTTHDDFPKFWASRGQLRTVTSVRDKNSISQGNSACFYGRQSDSSSVKCGTVHRTPTFCTSVVRPWDGVLVNVCNLVLARPGNINQMKGDSGGPWFVYNEAIGIHHGIANPAEITCNGATCLLFSKVDIAQERFGVFVQTG